MKRTDAQPCCFVLTDQNFVANLLGARGVDACVGVVRLEDLSLDELADLFFEVFDHRLLPPGTVVCAGSGSHLQSVGATLYAQDWNCFNAKMNTHYNGIRICPLTPITREDCPAALASDLSMLACWFARM